MKYLFQTSTTMKPYNNKQWWIDSNIVRDIEIDANSLKDALKEYRKIVENKYYIEISDNALKTKNEMYIDDKNGNPKQIGYVITGKTDFQTDDYKWKTQYIDLWITIKTIQYPF